MADGACATNVRTPREASLERSPRGGGGARKACYPGFLPDRPPHPPHPPPPPRPGQCRPGRAPGLPGRVQGGAGPVSGRGLDRRGFAPKRGII